MNNFLEIILLSMLPISELRGGIPLAIAYHIHPLLAFLVCTLANIAIVPLVFLFLVTVNRLLLKIDAYSRFFHHFLERAQHKIHKSVEKYGYLGLMIFVAIPLPMTGAYTGTLGAWALGMDKKKAFVSIALGVIIAGIIVTLISYYGFYLLDVFIKKPV
jgi:uncharacterized membrane protein